MGRMKELLHDQENRHDHRNRIKHAEMLMLKAQRSALRAELAVCEARIVALDSDQVLAELRLEMTRRVTEYSQASDAYLAAVGLNVNNE